MATSDDESATSDEVTMCPKCGKTPKVIRAMYNGRLYVTCRMCKLETPTAPSKEDALKLWNQGVFE